jgi:hypothetical protein
MPPNANASRGDEFRIERFIGVGCVTSVGGFFGGGMIAVLVARIVGWFRRCEPPTGLPACDWHLYMLAGAAIGVITLPALVIWRLRGGRGRNAAAGGGGHSE